jgi:hypothetical protein
MRHKEKEKERKKAETQKERERKKKGRDKELDTCKAWVAQLVIYKLQLSLQKLCI